MDEIWKAVVGYEGLYEVSNAGRVRSVERVAIRRNGRRHRVKSTVRTPSPNRKGHSKVTLISDAKLKTFLVHRLVLAAFVGPPEDGQMCRHLNGDPSDNRSANLAWGTASENQLDAVGHGTHYLAAKAVCRRGHQLSGTNLKTSASGRRVCRACKREHDAAHADGRPFCEVRAHARYADILAGVRRHKSEFRL